MTTHFSNGVTNVPGKMLGSSVFTKARQPLITGNNNEFAFQDDFVKILAGVQDSYGGEVEIKNDNQFLKFNNWFKC